MNEAVPLIRQKPAVNHLSQDWILVHLSRGICPTLEFDPGHTNSPTMGLSAEAIDLARQYDLFYVFEDPWKMVSNPTLLGSIPDLQDRTHYLGPIAVKTVDELPSRQEVLQRLGLRDQRIILLSLGRYGPILHMAEAILHALRSYCTLDDFQGVMVLDPYLDNELALKLQTLMFDAGVRVLSFTPPLIDLINISELVICRAGYNMVNEIIMTGAASIVIPERHPGGEQEYRAQLIRQDNIITADEEEIIKGILPSCLEALLSRKRKPSEHSFNKYAIGRRMLDDFENLRQLRQMDKA
jgi:predicted glycosyltransferase